MKDLSKQIRKFVASVLLAEAVLLVLGIVAAIGLNSAIKNKLASQMAREAGRLLVAGDTRQAIINLEIGTSEDFRSVEYVSNNGNKVFSLPPNYAANEHAIKLDAKSRIMNEMTTFDVAPKGSSDPLGRLMFRFARFDYVPYVAAGWALFALLSLPLLLRERQKIAKRAEEEAQTRSHLAIAHLTQMFAHDVRKPFSLLKMGLSMLTACESLEEARRATAKLVPEIDGAMTSITDMIDDVLEIGAKTELVTESIAPETLIEKALVGVFRSKTQAKIEFSYDLRHQHLAKIDALKITRILINIIDNAAHAMQATGQMWFKTRDVNSGDFIEFCIGNNGPAIAADDLPKVFDAFFTKGKKSGTGLGLAICKKIVSEHGGQIWCESSPEKGTEFYFLVPSSPMRRQVLTGSLPQNSSLVAKMFDIDGKPKRTLTEKDIEKIAKSEETLETEIFAGLSSAKMSAEILLVDDESIYLDFIKSSIEKSERLKKVTNISCVNDGDKAIEHAKQCSPRLIICDIDLGPNSPNGFDLVRQIRLLGSKAHICMHSNRLDSEVYKTAIEAGADSFLPKPMSRTHFLKILLLAVNF